MMSKLEKEALENSNEIAKDIFQLLNKNINQELELKDSTIESIISLSAINLSLLQNNFPGISREIEAIILNMSHELK